MAELPPYEIREYRPGDEQAILETFNRCFAQVDPNFIPRSMEEWRWQYEANPGGWRIWLAITEDGRVISQYAGVGQRMLVDGQPAKFSQAVDSMTDPAFRRGLKKPGFFVLTGYPYAANYGGPPPDGDTIMWGLPVPPAWRIGKTYLEYDMIRTEGKLVAEPGSFEPGSAAGVEARELDGWPPDLERLFARVAEGRGAIAVRDEAHLRWRFTDRPGHDYVAAEVRASGELVGLAVWRACVFDSDDDGLIAEWLVDPGRPEAAAALTAWAMERTRASGRERLTTVLPDTAPEYLDLQHRGFRVRPTRYFLVGRSYSKRHDLRWAYRHWYYTLGDTDLV
ncbi:MAG: GNAT family N-acetyltransferase [Planctomycetota bacterium]